MYNKTWNLGWACNSGWLSSSWAKTCVVHWLFESWTSLTPTQFVISDPKKGAPVLRAPYIYLRAPCIYIYWLTFFAHCFHIASKDFIGDAEANLQTNNAVDEIGSRFYSRRWGLEMLRRGGRLKVFRRVLHMAMGENQRWFSFQPEQGLEEGVSLRHRTRAFF